MPKDKPTKPKPPTLPKNPPIWPPDKGDLESLPGDPTTDAPLPHPPPPPPPPKKGDED